MLKYYTAPNDYTGSCDSELIQKAVDEASRLGCNRVAIPSYNRRTDRYLWEITETILLPSHMTVEINNAHLRMGDGVFCQMFRNSNGFEETGSTPDDEETVRTSTCVKLGENNYVDPENAHLRCKHGKMHALPSRTSFLPQKRPLSRTARQRTWISKTSTSGKKAGRPWPWPK